MFSIVQFAPQDRALPSDKSYINYKLTKFIYNLERTEWEPSIHTLTKTCLRTPLNFFKITDYNIKAKLSYLFISIIFKINIIMIIIQCNISPII